MNPAQLFSDPVKRRELNERFFSLVTTAHVMADTPFFLDFIAAQPDVRTAGMGTTAYCRGGLMSLLAAGRILAASSPRPPTRAAAWRTSCRTARSCWRRESVRASILPAR